MRLPYRLLMVVAFVLLPISALQVHTALEQEAERIDLTYAETSRLLRLIEDELTGTISSIQQILGTFSRTRGVMEADASACQRTLDRLKNLYPPYLSVYVTDRQGVVTCSTDPAAVGLDGSDRIHIQEALAGADFVVGNRIWVRTTGRRAVPFSMAYQTTDSDEVAGAIIALLDASWLETYLSDKPLPRTAVLTVADRDGAIIAQVPGQPDNEDKFLSPGLMARLRNSDSGVERIADADGIWRLVAFSPVEKGTKGLFLSVGIDETAELTDIHRGRNRALVLLGAIAWFTAITVFWLGRQYIEQPAARLSEAAARWRAGDLTARAGVARAAVEFHALARDFNAMADALDARERSLHASEAQHRSVFETAVDAMVVIDDQGLIQTTNPSVTRTFGYQNAELLGRNVSLLMGDEHRIRHDSYLNNYLSTGVRRIIGIGREVEGRRADGTLFPLELSIAEWLGPDARRYFTGIMRDISSRHAAERQAEVERGRLRRVIENAPFPAIVHAEGGEVLHISRAWLEITGYSREQLGTVDAWIDLAYRTIGEDEEDARTALKPDIERLYTLDRPLDLGEFIIRTAEGKKRVWAFRSSPVGMEPSGRRLVVSMAADVTERRDGEERLKLLMREVDHRAKNALMVVQSIVHLSRCDNPAQFAQDVEGRIQAMARAHSLLAAARWSGADLERLLLDELEAYGGDRVTVEGPQISLRPEATQAVSLALHELTTNAAKHGTLASTSGQLRIKWSLPEADRPLCIEWEELGERTITGPPTQEGFGSVLLRQVVEGQLGGSLTCAWLPEGLLCLISLPADIWQASGVRDTAPAATAAATTPLPVSPGRRILVVEDEALTALAVQTLLENAGYVVLGPVGRVEDALDLLRSGPPDAAVLDVNLFGATVDPVASALENMGVPFLFCTGYHRGGGVGENHPRAPVLNKPVNANNLLAAVNKLVS